MIALPVARCQSSLLRPSPLDLALTLLRLPLLGRFLRWRHARRRLQVPLLALAA